MLVMSPLALPITIVSIIIVIIIVILGRWLKITLFSVIAIILIRCSLSLLFAIYRKKKQSE